MGWDSLLTLRFRFFKYGSWYERKGGQHRSFEELRGISSLDNTDNNNNNYSSKQQSSEL